MGCGSSKEKSNAVVHPAPRAKQKRHVRHEEPPTRRAKLNQSPLKTGYGAAYDQSDPEEDEEDPNAPFLFYKREDLERFGTWKANRTDDNRLEIIVGPPYEPCWRRLLWSDEEHERMMAVLRQNGRITAIEQKRWVHLSTPERYAEYKELLEKLPKLRSFAINCVPDVPGTQDEAFDASQVDELSRCLPKLERLKEVRFDAGEILRLDD